MLLALRVEQQTARGSVLVYSICFDSITVRIRFFFCFFVKHFSLLLISFRDVVSGSKYKDVWTEQAIQSDIILFAVNSYDIGFEMR